MSAEAKDAGFTCWPRPRPSDIGHNVYSEHANSGGFQEEATWWKAYEREVAQLPGIALDAARGSVANLVGDGATAVSGLPAEQAKALLRQLPQTCRAAAQEVLLTAVARAAMHVWEVPGLTVDQETHGREGLFADLDTSRTVADPSRPPPPPKATRHRCSWEASSASQSTEMT